MTGLFSLYVPGDSVFHRLGVGWKYLLLLLLTIPGLLVGDPRLSLALLVAGVADAGRVPPCRFGTPGYCPRACGFWSP